MWFWKIFGWVWQFAVASTQAPFLNPLLQPVFTQENSKVHNSQAEIRKERFVRSRETIPRDLTMMTQDAYLGTVRYTQ
jgi:hypothetical protein